MEDRLGSRDLAFLANETPTAPRHNCAVAILDPGEEEFSFDTFLAQVADRLSFVPRYRQRVRVVPGRFAAPVWVDDDRFDLDYHVRRSAVPRPGTPDQLWELVSRIVARPLDRSRPLWEIYVVEGLADGRVAVLTKSHQALVDGVHTVDLGQVLFDSKPVVPEVDEDEAWNPRTSSAPALVFGAVRDVLTDAATLQATARTTGGFVLSRVSGVLDRVAKVAEFLTGAGTERPSPMSGPLSQQRLVVGVETRLEDYRRIRNVHGGTVNDVILAVVAGGLRGWLMTRAESFSGLRQIPVVVPISVIDEDLEATAMGTQIAPHLVDLPVGEASPVVRLHQVSYSFEQHRQTSRTVAADRLAGIAGFAPATFHAMGSRVAAADARGHQLSVTNVPGPQHPLYAAGARLVESYPVHPLEPEHAVTIGVTSYDGKVFLGVTADRDLVPDADVLGQCLEEALDELLDTATGVRHQVPRGRRDPKRGSGGKKQ